MLKLSQHEKEIVNLKIDYFIKCLNYIGSEFSIEGIPDKEIIEKVFRRFKKKNNLNSLGENFIWNYITYIFYVYLNSRHADKFHWGLVTSPKAFTLWCEKPWNWHEDYGNWLLESGLKRPKTAVKINIRGTEDIFRRKFLNTVKGFALCLENTSLIDPESRICKMCFKKLDCMNILKLNNPELYELRYGRNK